MKRKILKFLVFNFLLFPILLNGQVVITNATFPEVGDTLRTITTTNLGNFDKTKVGANAVWDLSGLAGGFLTLNTYVDPSEGDAADLFPEADLLNNSSLQEIYYKTAGDKIVEIGRSGIDPVLNLLDLTFENEGEAIFRTAPLAFNDSIADSSSFFISASASIIPDSILGGLAGSIDSLRLRVTTKHENKVDAWGTMKLPGGEYDVLRVKRKTSSTAVLGVKVLILGWVTVDPANPLFAQFGDLLDLLGETKTVNYLFYSNDSKEVVADAAEDPDGNMTSMTYKGDMTTAIDVINPKLQTILTYPNPTFGNVTFELMNLPRDNYKVVVYNIIGKQLWSSDIDYFSGRLNADLSHLRKGTYLYSLLNGKGQKITTRRLMIITP